MPNAFNPGGRAIDEVEDAGLTQPDEGHGVIDGNALSGLVMGDTALERELLEMFLRQCVVWTQVIRESQNRRVRNDAAHSLKGAALAVGASQLAARAAGIEDLPPNATDADELAAIAALHASVAQTRAAIAAMLTSDRFN